jgi:hypothetical protein
MIKICAFLALTIFMSTPTHSQQANCITGSEAPMPRPAASELWNRTIEETREVARKHNHEQEANFAKCLDSWIGRDISDLASYLGSPEKVTKMPKAEVIYLWILNADDRECRVSAFTLNGRIKKWQASGNACRRAT